MAYGRESGSDRLAGVGGQNAVAVEPKREAPIESVLALQFESTKQLLGLTERLEQRLSPILGPDRPPAPTEQKGVDQYYPPLLQSVDENTKAVMLANVRLRDILERLAI